MVVVSLWVVVRERRWGHEAGGDSSGVNLGGVRQFGGVEW